MYDTGGHLPVESLEEGATYLCHGPPMTGKRDLCLRLLAAGSGRDCPVVVSTDSAARRIRAEYGQHATDRAADRFGVVDCTGEAADGDSPLVHTTSSPADLTGVGVGTTTLVETLHGEYGCRRYRVGVCSLTSMFLYAEPERVLKFTHVLAQRLDEANALGVLVLQERSVDPDVFNQLRTLVDGTIELREGDGGTPECRVRGVPDAPADWAPLGSDDADTGVGAVVDDGSVAAGIDDGDWAADSGDGDDWLAGAAGESRFDSLSAIVAAVDEERPTLSVYNYDGDAESLRRLATHCETMNVAFREGTLDEDEPRNVALLHHGTDLVEGVPVESLLGALEVSESDVDAFSGTESVALLSDLGRSTFGARGASRAFLIEVSHVIEMAAWRADEGTLHAGFQELSRLWTDAEARRIYRRLAESGVDVHVYGVPDVDSPAWDGLTVHGVGDDEISASWFVVYDGGGDPDAKATLLAEEREPGTYHGFWTFQPERTDETLAYLDATYGDGGRSSRSSGPDTTAP